MYILECCILSVYMFVFHMQVCVYMLVCYRYVSLYTDLYNYVGIFYMHVYCIYVCIYMLLCIFIRMSMYVCKYICT